MASRLTVLVVENDPRTSLTLATLLRQQGWEAVSASDASNALAMALKTRPAAVVINAKLPGGGGLTALRRIRGSVNTATLPVVIMGSDAEPMRRAYYDAGAQAYLELSAPPLELVAVIQGHLATPIVVEQAPRADLEDAVRLAALQASGLLDATPDASFDRITRLVTRLLDAPTALLSLVDKDRQVFKSLIGLPEPWASERQTPLSHSFCQWVVSGRDQIAVDDARLHPVLRSNAAIKDLGVIAYAGVPVWSDDGHALGSLCAIDAKPRAWTRAELDLLASLTRVIEGCAAQAQLTRRRPEKSSDFDRYIGAAGEAITGAAKVLRVASERLNAEDRGSLLDVIDGHGRNLVQLNRLMQVRGALH